MAKPIKFKESNVIYAENQLEYKQLPAFKDEDGFIITCWELSKEEIDKIVKTKKIYVSMLTFNKDLQPLMVETDISEFIKLKF